MFKGRFFVRRHAILDGDGEIYPGQVYDFDVGFDWCVLKRNNVNIMLDGEDNDFVDTLLTYGDVYLEMKQ